MTKTLDKADKAEHGMNRGEARKIHDAFLEHVKEHEVIGAKVWRSSFEAIRGKIWEAFDLPDDKTYIDKFFGRTSMTIAAFRQGHRIWGQFKNGASKLRDVKPEEIETYAEETIERALTALGNNTSRLGELSRTPFFGETRRETEANIRAAREIHDVAKTPQEFKKKMEAKFGLVNENRSKGNKQAAAARKAKGKTISVRLDFPINNHKVFQTAVETVSVSTGARQAYGDMKASDLADHVFLFANAYNRSEEAQAIQVGLTPEIRKRIAGANLAAAYSILAKVPPSEAFIEKMKAQLLRVMEEEMGGERAG